jgi:hypothetical protein
MKRGRQIDRDDRVPAFLGKRHDLCDMLDSGVIDEDVDAAELLRRLGDEFAYLRRLCHVSAGIRGTDAVALGKAGPQPLYGGGVTEAVQHDIATLGGQRRRDAEPDPAGRAGNNRGLAFQHRPSPVLPRRHAAAHLHPRSSPANQEICRPNATHSI